MLEKIGNGEPYFIAEMSANHGNDLGIALAIVDAAAEAGADCLKVQTYTADSITLDCDNEYFQIHGGLWDGYCLHDLYEGASLPYEWHEPIMERCIERGLDFLSTPFDERAVDFLEELGVDAYKIASFELNHIPLLEYAASKGKPMVVSTGMGSLEEVREAVGAVHSQGNENLVLLRCCSDYPADPAVMNLSSIPELARKTGCHVGFSDHSMGYVADVVAVTLGARVIEKHFCLSKDIKSADVEFSMTPEEYAEMVIAVRRAVAAVGLPTFGPSSAEEHNLMFRRSIFASAPIRTGEVFTESNIRVVRPAQGAHPRFYGELLGRVSDRDYAFGDPIVYGG